MTEFAFDQPDEFNEGGDFLNTPGTYHFSVNDIMTEDKEGNLINGFKVNLEVLHGTVQDKQGNCTEKNKQTSITFFNPKLSGRDGGRFARQKQAAFFVAAGVIGPAELDAIRSKSLKSVDLEKARGAQIVMTVELDDTGKYLNPSYCNIWHVDDPKAANFPKNKDAIALLPKDRRLTAEKLQEIKDAFSGKSSGDNGNGAAASQPQRQQPQQQPVAAGAGDINIDDL